MLGLFAVYDVWSAWALAALHSAAEQTPNILTADVSIWLSGKLCGEFMKEYHQPPCHPLCMQEQEQQFREQMRMVADPDAYVKQLLVSDSMGSICIMSVAAMLSFTRVSHGI